MTQTTRNSREAVAILREIYVWFLEGSSPLSPDAMIFDDERSVMETLVDYFNPKPTPTE